MSTPILTTKLYIPPPRPNVVSRPRLIKRLNEGLGSKVILISAQAGFGKTTLVSEWLSELRTTNDELQLDSTKENQIVNRKSKIVNSIAWLSLDEGDNDNARFLAYLIAALQTIAPQVGDRVLAMLQSPQPPPLESMMTSLINDLATIEGDCVLILDDYHLIESITIDDALAFLIEHLPPQLHLVIATREDPNLPLPRLRVRGQLTEIRAADLRFTAAEAADFLNQAMGLSLSEDDIAALETRTEGWIAGLQMAALALQGSLSMQGRQDATDFIQAFTGSHRFVLDYLMEEVLQGQPQQVRNFLLQTAILERLSGSLCDAVTGQDNGKGLLESLERGNLFVVPLDDQRQWYRYHHLFADVLQARLLEEQPDQVSGLHLRASVWYEQNDFSSDAIRHAFATEDFERAANLVELAGSSRDRIFLSAAWMGWVQALPDALIRARPVLSLACAWTLLGSGELEAGEARLRDAERWLASLAEDSEETDLPAARMVVTDEAEFQLLPASLAAARAYFAQALGDVPGTIKYARRALDLYPPENHVRRGAPAGLLGIAHWASGELEAAYQTISEAMINFQKVGHTVYAISGTYGLADMRLAQGRFREAVRLYEQSLQWVEVYGDPMLQGTADLYTGLADLHREQGDLAVAAEYLLKAEDLGEHAALPDWPHRHRTTEARFKLSQGELNDALDLLNEAERLFYRSPVPDVRPIPAWKARVLVAQGRLSEALAWARERDLSTADELTFLQEFEHITLVRILIARYRQDQIDSAIREAMTFLGRLLKAAETGERQGSMIEILILQALAFEAQGDTLAALVPLERALTLAEPEGYVRTFVDEGPPMATLLREAVKQSAVPTYVQQLLAAFGDEVPAKQTKRKTATQPLIEPLSDRELEVLRLLKTELSGPEIARELLVSLNTMRTHTKNIYNKLGVNNRRAAVRRAEELDLV